MRPRIRMTTLLPMLAAAIVMTGCPLLQRTNVDPSSVQIALVVEPTEIFFGTDATERSFTVRRSFSSRNMPPFRVTTSVPWLSVTPEEAISTGPDDLVTITVIATRTGLAGGESTGRITVSADNVEPITIQVRLQQPLSANFEVNPTSPFALNPVEFTDTSRIADGVAAVISWLWDFGDGTTSTEQDPVHIYEEAGLYSVTLTVSNGTITQTITREDLIEVREAVPPEVDFTAQPTSAFVGETVSFANFTTQGSASPIEYEWNFGDGGTSNAENPTHSYLAPGTYTVSLTATTPAGSDTLTKNGLITVTTTTPPTADFSTNVATALPGQVIQFRDESTPGSLPIDGWLWEFNDPNNPNDTSTEQNPTFAYAQPGTYTVTLTVTAGLDSDSITRQAAITIDEFTALDKYVRKPDPAFGFREVGRVERTGYTAHVLHFVSQQWRTADDIYAIGGRRTTEWEHNLIIVRPRLTPPAFPKLTGFLIISGGSNPRSTPDGVLIGLIGQAVEQSGAVVAVLEQVPNQPIQYETHIDPLREPRVEDNAIAVSYRQFLNEVPFLNDPSDTEWPLLLPMVKSTVRAMDATQQFMASQGVTVNDFVVAGASKRGWTTWLTAATDPGQRVVGIMPLVIDVLNMVPSLSHHWQVYGLWSDAIRDYERERVFDEIDTIEGALLREIVDPWEYRGRLTMPKYIINSTGDQFFVLDSSQFYYSELLGESRIRTIPNTDHGLSGPDQRDASAQVIFDSLPFFASVADRRVDAMPDIEWQYNEATSTLRITPSVTPQTVRLWSAVDNLDDGAPPFNEAVGNQRNFRLDRLGPVWQSVLLNRDPDGSYSVVVDLPTQEGVWKGFFAEVRFGTGHRFTTEVFVRPTNTPFLPPNLGD